MNLEKLQRNWDKFGQIDPMWAILTDPAKRGRRWEAGEFFETGKREVAELMSLLGAMCLPASRRKALDFGCGIGRLSQALAGYFEEVHGVDIAPSMIGRARDYNAHGIRCHYHLNPVPSLELFPNDTFDLIYSSITLQHIEPEYSVRYIREFVRVLACGGALVFRLPSLLRLPNPPPKTFRQRIKQAVPAPALRMYYWAKAGRGPKMEMHGIEREQVVQLLKQTGARLLEVAPDDSAGDAWVCFRYLATKP